MGRGVQREADCGALKPGPSFLSPPCQAPPSAGALGLPGAMADDFREELTWLSYSPLR